LVFLFCFGLSVLSVFLFSKLSKRFNVVFNVYGKEIPSLGGVGLFVGLLPILWRDPFSLFAFSFSVVVGLLLELFRSLKIARYSLEFVLAIALVWRFVGLENPWYSFLLVFIVVFLLNTVKAMDEMDGVCASVAVAVSFTFYFMLHGSFARDLALGFLFSALGYLLFNFPPARVVMGEVGRYISGAVLTSFFLSVNERFVFKDFLASLLPFWLLGLDLLASFVKVVTGNDAREDHFYNRLFRKIGGVGVKGLRKTLALVLALQTVFCLMGVGAYGSTTLAFVNLGLSLLFSAMIVKQLRLFRVDKW